MAGALRSQAAWQHDDVERRENETCVESKSTAPRYDPALEKEPVEVYFAGSVAPELVIE
ncbi:hypothetical protein BDR04DRAFT_1095083 [Suillus decipiens]|nr:hypothetical protein BDR04DRAFT_1095083 [Suillus decipiens]